MRGGIGRHHPFQVNPGARQPDKKQSAVDRVQLGHIAFSQHHSRRGLPLEAANGFNQQLAVFPDWRAAFVELASETVERPGPQLVQALQHRAFPSPHADDGHIVQVEAALQATLDGLDRARADPFGRLVDDGIRHFAFVRGQRIDIHIGQAQHC